MHHRTLSLAVVLVAATVAAAAGLRAQPADDDPGNVFPRAAQAPAAPPTGGPLDTLELRGAMRVGGRITVVLFDNAKGRSMLVDVDQTVDGIRVASYENNGKTSTVLVEAAGKARRIQMKESAIVPVAVAPPPGPVLAGGPPGSPGAPPGAVGAGSDAEVRDRMAKVAEEIRRRRAMRREMLQNAQQQPPPPEPPPP
jgi:hypothetical protein